MKGIKMAKNVLLLVTGMSPAIVTETVYGLAVNPMDGREKWIPDEVHIISTEHGLVQVRERLLDKKNFQKLIDDYQLPNIKFDESQLYPIVDQNGQPQNDLRTPEDNERAANLICEKVRYFTSDKDEHGNEKPEHEKVASLHVSIAGGRKTMGFYIGYALSLYGRPQDHMSHVLVEAPFDETKVPDFYYPTPYPHNLPDFYNTFWNVQQAKIWLSYIPFVRLRASLPESSLLKNATFSEVVNTINLANQPISVQLNMTARTVTIGQKTVRLAPREFAFYCWFAELAQAQSDSIPAIVEGEHRPLPRLFELWKGADSQDPTDPKSGTFDKPFFEQRLAKIKSIFVDEFTESVAKAVLVQLKDGRGSGYILPLTPEQICIVAS